MNLLHTLVISYQIFELVTTKKIQMPTQAELNAGDVATEDVVGGFVDPAADVQAKTGEDDAEKP